jgi:hypothetical protein
MFAETFKPGTTPLQADTPKRGRPTLYTPEIASEICARLSTGISLRQACDLPHLVDPATVIAWRMTDFRGFSQQYTRAREAQHHAMADRILELASMEPRMIVQTVSEKGSRTVTETKIDPAFETWRKTEIAALQWAISRILRAEYGDHTSVDVNVQETDTSKLSRAELLAIASKGRVVDAEFTPTQKRIAE